MSSTSKLVEGSRPPPSKRPSTSSLSVLFVMALVVAGAFIASGSLVPLDPNGPGGPPTLEPYYNTADYPQQHIVPPTGSIPNGQQKLQLQTFNVDNCGENSAIMFVIDTSGSMSYAGKMDNTKRALHYFVNNIGGKTVIGINTFSKDVITKLYLSYYKDVKKQVPGIINGLTPGGWTRTRDALESAKEELTKSIRDEDYPGYQYNLVLMTDGVPEIPDAGRHCEVTVPDPNLANGIRCFAREEDPRYPTDVSNEIKALGVDIYTINVYSPSYRSDKLLFPYLEALLKEVASPPLNTHYYVSTNASNLSEILKNISNSICYGSFNGIPKPTVGQ